MKIHGLCLVKNEEDIIAESLGAASRWCDRIHVFDTGSTDGTWDIVCRLAWGNPAVKPFRCEKRAFNDSLRSEIFRAVRAEAAEGDWWCRLDADEIYIDDPKMFLAAVPARHHVVFSASCQFYFTDTDLTAWERAPGELEKLPVGERLRYYLCDHSEARFFRHRDRLVWDSGSWPVHVGVVHPRRIRLKHLQYRSPEQIRRRLATRQEASCQGWKLFDAYDSTTDWRDKVVPASGLQFDDHSGSYAVDEAVLPTILENPVHRMIKHVMHGTGLWP